MSPHLLAAIYLGESLVGLTIQLAGLTRIAPPPGSPTPVARLVRRGMLRTALSRVFTSSVYVTVGVVSLMTTGILSPTTLIVFGGLQLLWIYNAGADAVLRWRLDRHDGATGPVRAGMRQLGR